MYEDLLDLKQPGCLLARLAPPPQRNPSLGFAPPEYIKFVEEIGVGIIGKHQFVLYETFADPLTLTTEPPADVVIFGDDFAGYCGGFRTTDWTIIGMDLSGEVTDFVGSFEQYIREIVENLR